MRRVRVRSLNWSYWSLNGNDDHGVLANDFSALANAAKEYTFLCAIERGPLAVPAGPCGSTGALPAPQ
jgi:hypothetical protein